MHLHFEILDDGRIDELMNEKSTIFTDTLPNSFFFLFFDVRALHVVRIAFLKNWLVEVSLNI